VCGLRGCPGIWEHPTRLVCAAQGKCAAWMERHGLSERRAAILRTAVISLLTLVCVGIAGFALRLLVAPGPFSPGLGLVATIGLLAAVRVSVGKRGYFGEIAAWTVSLGLLSCVSVGATMWVVADFGGPYFPPGTRVLYILYGIAYGILRSAIWARDRYEQDLPPSERAPDAEEASPIARASEEATGRYDGHGRRWLKSWQWLAIKGAVTVAIPIALAVWVIVPLAMRVALWEAVREGDLGKVEALVERGVNDCSPTYWTPVIYWAACSDDPRIGRVLLDGGTDIEARGYRGQTALIQMCDDYRSAVGPVKQLIDWGANVNARDDEGRTALHYASAKRDSKIVQLLLSSGAEPLRKANSPW